MEPEVVIQTLTIRCFGFVLALGFLPLTFAPIITRLSCAAALLIFAVPYALASIGHGSILGQGEVSELILWLMNPSDSRTTGLIRLPNTTTVITEMGIGAFLAVIVSFPIYAGKISAAWIAATAGAGVVESERSARNRNIHGMIYAVIVVFSLNLTFSSPFLPTIWAMLLKSISIAPLAESTNFANAAALIIVAAGRAFAAAMLIVLPLFIVSVAYVLLIIPAKRYFPDLAMRPLYQAAAMPLVLLAVSVFFPWFSSELSRLYATSYSHEMASEALKLIDVK